MQAADWLSPRLAQRLRHDGVAPETIARLAGTDFSSGRAGESAAWAAHNERVHVAVLIVSADRDLDAALELAELDWRDVLVAARLADGDWRARIEAWFSRRTSP